jgi:hypothetical protein
MALMLSMPVSALSTLKVTDGKGDQSIMFDPKTGELDKLWPASTAIAQAGYLDISSAWLTQKGKTYTFGMELAKALPEVGTPLPHQIRSVDWSMWIDPSPWNSKENPVSPLFQIALTYDGTAYSAFVANFVTMERNAVSSLSIGTSTFELEFSAESISDQAFSWWVPAVGVNFGPTWSAGSVIVDMIDWDSTNGQVWYDLPWPPL